MADKRKAPAAPEGAHRRKRAAPTIDLAATEVPMSAQPASAEPPPHEAMHAAPPEPPPPPQEPPHVATAPPPGDTGPRLAAAHASGNWLGAVAAGAAGAAVMAALLAVLWFSGALPSASTDTTDVSAQVAALQKQVQALQSRPAPSVPAVDTKAVDALGQRVAKMEDALAKLPKGDSDLAQRLAAAENAMKSLGVALTALTRRNDDMAAGVAQATARAEAAEKAVAQLRGSVQDVAKGAAAAVTPAELEALQQRLAALEQSTKAGRADIAKTSASDKAARLALSAAALRTAVVSGAPYQDALAQTKALGADANKLAPLVSFADKGVPSEAALAQELRALLPAIIKAAGAEAPPGGFLERLQANASKLVRVQPVDAPPGDDAAAVLARLEVEAARADIAGALADLAKLPDAARAPAQGWIAKATARQAALAAARDLAADAARALGQP